MFTCISIYLPIVNIEKKNKKNNDIEKDFKYMLRNHVMRMPLFHRVF